MSHHGLPATRRYTTRRSTTWAADVRTAWGGDLVYLIAYSSEWSVEIDDSAIFDVVIVTIAFPIRRVKGDPTLDRKSLKLKPENTKPFAPDGVLPPACARL